MLKPFAYNSRHVDARVASRMKRLARVARRTAAFLRTRYMSRALPCPALLCCVPASSQNVVHVACGSGIILSSYGIPCVVIGDNTVARSTAKKTFAVEASRLSCSVTSGAKSSRVISSRNIPRCALYPWPAPKGHDLGVGRHIYPELWHVDVGKPTEAYQ